MLIALSPPIYRKDTGTGFSAANLDEVITARKKVAAETGARLIDVHAVTSNQPEKFGDGVHPNEEGKALIAKTVFEAIAA